MIKKRSIFFNGVIIATTGFLCLYLYKYLAPQHRNVLTEQILDALGLTVILFGQYLRISARGYKFEKHFEKAVLITDGPYALTRNPMYLASFLIGFGLMILLLKWWILPIYIVFFLAWYWSQIHNEQELLKKKFGQEYAYYCKTTPCFFPRLKTLISFNARKYIPLKITWIKKEWNTILVWSVVAFVAEGYQDINFYSFGDFVREFILLLLIIFFFTAFAVMFRVDKDS